MTSEMIDKLARETVDNEVLRAFSLDPVRVAAAIARAKKLHDEEVAIFAVRDPSASLIPRLSGFRRTIEKARREWASIEAADRQYVQRFISADEPDEVEEKLLSLLDLMEEFEIHFGRQPGNPQRSRDGQNLDLRPLYAFVEVLRDFWLNAVGEDMGSAVVDRDKATGEASTAASQAMAFLSDAVTALDVPYSVTSLQTVVRRLRRAKTKSPDFD